MDKSATVAQPRHRRHPVARAAIFLYGLCAYIAFVGTFLYAVGFIGGFSVPKSLDSEPTSTWTKAVSIDVVLLCVFALQHSIMARPAFKRLITCLIPASAERSTFVLASNAALALLFWKWEPIGGTVWQADSRSGTALLYAGYAFGWVLVLVTTFAIHHFDLFGLRQVWRELLGKPQAKLQFVAPVLYRIVRHPLYVGWLFAFWGTPRMTVSHLVFAIVTTTYILVALRFEESDLNEGTPGVRSLSKASADAGAARNTRCVIRAQRQYPEYVASERDVHEIRGVKGYVPDTLLWANSNSSH